MYLHEQIEASILSRIQEGELRPGDLLEPELLLAQRFGTSRATVRQALLKLMSEGYLTRVKGKGTFVSEPKLLQENTRFISSYRMEAQRKNLSVHTRVLELKKVSCPREAAERLMIPEGAPVTRLVRLRTVSDWGDRPVVYTTVYIPCRLFPDMDRIDFSDVSLYETLEQRGLAVRRVVREIEVRPISAEVGKLLCCSGFEPVFFIPTVGYLEDNTPVEYSESIYPSSNNKFVVEITR